MEFPYSGARRRRDIGCFHPSIPIYDESVNDRDASAHALLGIKP
jgi:hypothetical protein